jgi:hypothetical protein
MNHAAASEKLLELAYGELAPREARAVEAHAASCEACGAELARIRETRALMALLPVEPPPERGEGIVLAAAREAAASSRKPRALLPPWLWAGTAGAMAAALVAVVSWRLTREPAAEPFQPSETELLGRGAPAVAAAPQPATPAAVPRAKHEPAAAPPEASGSAMAPAKRAEATPQAPMAGLRREESRERMGAAGAGAGRSASALERGAAPSGGGWRPAEAEAAPAAATSEPSAAERPALANEDRAALGPQPFAAAPAPPPAPAPAQKARAMAPAERKSAAPEEGRAAALRAEGAPGSVETRSFDGCPGERARIVQRDAEGRLVVYVRFLADSRRIEQRYGPDGRLIRAGLIDGKVARPLPLDTPWLVRDARDAAIDAPPRCQVP